MQGKNKKRLGDCPTFDKQNGIVISEGPGKEKMSIFSETEW